MSKSFEGPNCVGGSTDIQKINTAGNTSRMTEQSPLTLYPPKPALVGDRWSASAALYGTRPNPVGSSCFSVSSTLDASRHWTLLQTLHRHADVLRRGAFLPLADGPTMDTHTSSSVAENDLFCAVPTFFPFLAFVRTGLLSPGSKTSEGRS